MEQLSFFQPPSLTVSELTRYLRQLLESDDVLRTVWVQGEISNLSRPASGHIYFTLKDEGAALRCVIWRATAQALRVPLQNGLAVEAHGAISVYERDGQYQLYVQALRPAGAGFLYQEFLRLKARLEADGLFDEGRKRPIPARPRAIGIVTSPTGAALQDMLNTLRRRYPLAEVWVAPAAVQGAEAPGELVRALRALNRLAQVDVILIGRGGGSLEDLWAFNDEAVVRAVAGSPQPVISGVGHETDFTLVDFAADVRAPTPTGAAVLATPDVADLRLALFETRQRLESISAAALLDERSRLVDAIHRLQRNSPLRRIQNDRQRLDQLAGRNWRAAAHLLQLRRAALHGAANHLQALNPLAVLQRGFAVVTRPDGALIGRAAGVQPGERVHIRLADGQIDAHVDGVSTNE